MEFGAHLRYADLKCTSFFLPRLYDVGSWDKVGCKAMVYGWLLLGGLGQGGSKFTIALRTLFFTLLDAKQ